MAAAAITRSKLKIDNCNLDHLMAAIDRFRHIGIHVEKYNSGCEVAALENSAQPILPPSRIPASQLTCRRSLWRF